MSKKLAQYVIAAFVMVCLMPAFAQAAFQTTQLTAFPSTGVTASIRAIAVGSGNPSPVFVAGDSFQRSTDSGVSWAAMNTGLVNAPFTAVAVDPLSANTVYVTTSSEIARTTDGGTNWTVVNSNLGGCSGVYTLAIDPQTTSTLYSGINAAICKSVDGGASWTAYNTGLVNAPFTTVVIDPVNPSVIYAATEGFAAVGGVPSPSGMFQSVDGGVSWTALDTTVTGVTVYAMAVDPVTTSTIYAGTDTGFYTSTDSGVTWAQLKGAFIGSIAINPTTPSTLYIGSNGGGVLESKDSGATWLNWSGAVTSESVYWLAIDTAAPTVIYAGAYSGSLYRAVSSTSVPAPIGSATSAGGGGGCVMMPASKPDAVFILILMAVCLLSIRNFVNRQQKVGRGS